MSVNRLNIGIDCRMMGWGGVGRYTKGLVKGLQQIHSEHKFVLICNETNEIDVFNPNFRKITVGYPVFSIKHAVAFRNIVRKLALDVFHSPHFIYPWLYKGKGVATIHDLIPMRYPKTMFFSDRLKFIFATKLTVNKVSHIIAVSENTKRDLSEILGCARSKITTIHEAVDDIFNETIENGLNGLSLPDSFFLYVGAFRLHKNIEGVLKAYRLLPKAIKKKHGLVLIGKNDRRYVTSDRLIKKYGLKKYVHNIENVGERQLVSVYQKAKMLLMPSFYEGFGLPALEAMMCDTPVIASNNSSFPELLGKDAILVNPCNTKEISDAIMSLINDEERYERYKKDGKKRAASFSWLRAAQETINVYEKVGFG